MHYSPATPGHVTINKKMCPFPSPSVVFPRQIGKTWRRVTWDRWGLVPLEARNKGDGRFSLNSCFIDHVYMHVAKFQWCRQLVNHLLPRIQVWKVMSCADDTFPMNRCIFHICTCHPHNGTCVHWNGKTNDPPFFQHISPNWSQNSGTSAGQIQLWNTTPWQARIW